jgi:hypothetical protein
MGPGLYITIWVALMLFTLAEGGKRRLAQHRAVPGWAWPAWLLGAGLCAIHILIAFGDRHGWSHDAAVRETARQTAVVYGTNWGGGVYVNYVFVAAWWIEAGWWRMNPSSYFDRRRAITWALRAFYGVIIVNAAVVFASVPSRALGVLLVGALAWIWRPCL